MSSFSCVLTSIIGYFPTLKKTKKYWKYFISFDFAPTSWVYAIYLYILIPLLIHMYKIIQENGKDWISI